MINGELNIQIDKLWTEFWSGGITNPLMVIEQISFLMFAWPLDIREIREENDKKAKIVNILIIHAKIVNAIMRSRENGIND